MKTRDIKARALAKARELNKAKQDAYDDYLGKLVDEAVAEARLNEARDATAASLERARDMGWSKAELTNAKAGIADVLASVDGQADRETQDDAADGAGSTHDASEGDVNGQAPADGGPGADMDGRVSADDGPAAEAWMGGGDGQVLS